MSGNTILMKRVARGNGRGRARTIVGASVALVVAVTPLTSWTAGASATSPAGSTASCATGFTCGDVSPQLGPPMHNAPVPISTLPAGAALTSVPCSDPTAAARTYCQLDGTSCRYYGTFKGLEDGTLPYYANTFRWRGGSTGTLTGLSQADTAVGLNAATGAAVAVSSAGSSSWLNDSRDIHGYSTVGTGVDWFGSGWDNASVNIVIKWKDDGTLTWGAAPGSLGTADFKVEIGQHMWLNQQSTDLGETITGTVAQDSNTGAAGGNTRRDNNSGSNTVSVSFNSYDSILAFVKVTTDAYSSAFGFSVIPGGAAATSDFGGAAANSGQTPENDAEFQYSDWHFDRGVNCN